MVPLAYVPMLLVCGFALGVLIGIQLWRRWWR